MSHYVLKKLCVGGMVWIVLLLPQLSYAALLYIDPREATLNRGDTTTLALRLDTDEGECINTADVVIEYDASIRAVDVSRGESILNIWVENPRIDAEQRTITFAGGIPGGYCGRIAGDPSLTNILAELVFRSPGFNVGGTANSKAEVRISGESQVLLHDGFGTRANLRTIGATILLRGGAGQSIEDDWLVRISNDTTPPAPFSITLARDTAAFSGKYFITFNSQDKQSGVDHYEVMEEPFEEFNLFRWGAANAPWTRVESPYVLKDQSLNSTIRVRAIDKAGLETIAILVPDEALRSFSLLRVITISVSIVTTLLIVGLIGYALFRRKQSLVRDFEHEHDVQDDTQ